MHERGSYGKHTFPPSGSAYAYSTLSPVVGLEPETKRTALRIFGGLVFIGIGAYWGAQAAKSEATKNTSMILGGAAGWFASNLADQTQQLRRIANAQYR